MKSVILETIPIAALVAAEAFFTVFAVVWAGMAIIGEQALALEAGLGFAVVATVLTLWAIFRMASRATSDPVLTESAD